MGLVEPVPAGPQRTESVGPSFGLGMRQLAKVTGPW